MLNRRHIFGASAAALIASVPAVSVAAPSADAKLLMLGAQYERIHAEYQEAVSRSWATYETYKAKRPAPPEALFVTQMDAADFGGLWQQAGKPLSPHGYDHLEKWLANSAHRNMAVSARLEPRARELLKSYDDHEAADQAVMTEHKAASEAEDAIYDRVCEIERAIMDAPCSTMAGLRVKALVAQRNRPPSDHTPSNFSEQVAQAVVDAILNGGLN